jgi:adenylate cyclase
VQDEAAEGRDTGRLVPAILGSVRPPLGFRQFQSVVLGTLDDSPDGSGVDQLVDAIQKLGSNTVSKQSLTQTEERGQPQTSICVLPFVNMSGDPEQEYFSDGITEDIITDLSKVSALFVIARNTAFTFKGRVMDVKEVAHALDVTHVLEGSVRKAGDRVRITAQLIDATTGGHLWADRYDRDLTDIFAIQDEISKAIVGALRVKLLPQEKRAIETRGTTSVEAYNLYLMARQQWITGSSGDIRRDETIVRICKQALSFDPNYAHAWALMALAQSQLRMWHARDENPLPAAERALEIDPTLAEARCIKAHMLEEQGKPDEAIAEIQVALQSDSESWEVNREAARLMFRQGRIREAIPYFEKAAALIDTDWHNVGMLMTCYHETGEEDQLRRVSRLAVERVEKALAKDPANASALATGAGALARLGEDQRAKDWIDRALLLDPDNILMRYNLACALVADLGDNDRAVDVMGPYFERTLSTAQIKHADVDPDLDPIRDDARFKSMMADAKQRLGMAEAVAK